MKPAPSLHRFGCLLTVGRDFLYAGGLSALRVPIGPPIESVSRSVIQTGPVTRETPKRSFRTPVRITYFRILLALTRKLGIGPHDPSPSPGYHVI